MTDNQITVVQAIKILATELEIPLEVDELVELCMVTVAEDHIVDTSNYLGIFGYYIKRKTDPETAFFDAIDLLYRLQLDALTVNEAAILLDWESKTRRIATARHIIATDPFENW